MKPTDFAIRLTNFLGEYLSAQKNVSPNTIKAYRDAFKLLLRYCRDYVVVSPENLTLDTLNVQLIQNFLNHIENEGNCSIRTRNHRLSVLHAFFRYLQIEEPGRITQCQQILAIPLKRYTRSISPPSTRVIIPLTKITLLQLKISMSNLKGGPALTAPINPMDNALPATKA